MAEIENERTSDWEAVHLDDGQVYFWNASTDEVTWEAPDEGGVEPETVTKVMRRPTLHLSADAAVEPSASAGSRRVLQDANVPLLREQARAAQKQCEEMQRTYQKGMLERVISAGLAAHAQAALTAWRMVVARSAGGGDGGRASMSPPLMLRDGSSLVSQSNWLEAAWQLLGPGSGAPTAAMASPADAVCGAASNAHGYPPSTPRGAVPSSLDDSAADGVDALTQLEHSAGDPLRALLGHEAIRALTARSHAVGSALAIDRRRLDDERRRRQRSEAEFLAARDELVEARRALTSERARAAAAMRWHAAWRMARERRRWVEGDTLEQQQRASHPRPPRQVLTLCSPSGCASKCSTSEESSLATCATERSDASRSDADALTPLAPALPRLLSRRSSSWQGVVPTRGLRRIKSWRGLEEAYTSQRIEIERLSMLLAEHATELANTKLELAQLAFSMESKQARGAVPATLTLS